RRAVFFAWLDRNRRLARDFEATITSAEAFLYAGSAMLLLRIFRLEAQTLDHIATTEPSSTKLSITPPNRGNFKRRLGVQPPAWIYGDLEQGGDTALAELPPAVRGFPIPERVDRCDRYSNGAQNGGPKRDTCFRLRIVHDHVQPGGWRVHLGERSNGPGGGNRPAKGPGIN